MPEDNETARRVGMRQGQRGLSPTAQQGASARTRGRPAPAGGPLVRGIRRIMSRAGLVVAGACWAAIPIPAHLLSEAVGLARDRSSIASIAVPAFAAADTMVVTAARETVTEVIAAIGERMRRDAALRGAREHTTLTTVVEVHGAGRPDSTVVQVDRTDRHRRDPQGRTLTVGLWERTRTFRHGLCTADERRAGGPCTWTEPAGPLVEALPFAPGAADRYDYAIESRRLIGNTLIYRIAFAPRHRFDPLPSGRIWVDYTNWAIRKLEASLTGPSPSPLFLRRVPVYRLIQRRYGGIWLPAEVAMVLELRPSPLVGGPDRLAIRTRITDVVVDGAPVPAGEGLGPGDVDPRGPDERWLDPAAAADSLAVFWDEVERDLPSLQPWDRGDAPGAGPEPAVGDSLRRQAQEQLERRWAAGPPWTVAWSLGRGPWFNRVQGLVPRAGVDIQTPGGATGFTLAAGYGLACGRPEGRAAVRHLLASPSGQGSSQGLIRKAGLEIVLAADKAVAPFGGDGRVLERSLSAATYGGDPNHYRETRSLGAGLAWRPDLQVGRSLTLTAGAAHVAERPLPAATLWNLAGIEPNSAAHLPAANLPAAALDGRRVTLGAEWRTGSFAAQIGRDWVTLDEGATQWSRHLRRWRLQAQWEGLDRWGHRWTARAAHESWSDPAPAQWQVWLGDYGSLRGRPAGTLRGDAGTWASLDVRLDADPLTWLKAPVLKNLRLQPLLFVDWGTTTAASILTGPGTTGGALDAGVGLGWRLGLPVLKERPWVRLYAGWPVAGSGEAGSGTRWVLALER